MVKYKKNRNSKNQQSVKEYRKIMTKMNKHKKSGFGTYNYTQNMWNDLKNWVSKYYDESSKKSEEMYEKLKTKWNNFIIDYYKNNNNQISVEDNPITTYTSPSGEIAQYPYDKMGNQVEKFGERLTPTYEIMGPWNNSYYR
jgi:hypothetical protein